MVEFVESIADGRLDAYARLTDVQLRSRLEPERALFIAESEKVVHRALDAGFQPQSVLVGCEQLESPAVVELLGRVKAAYPECPVLAAPRAELTALTGFQLTRGVLAAFRRPPQPSLSQVLADARRVAVLEDITNHTNVGAIFRSAAALGVDGVLVTPGCYDPLYRRAIRVSMGTVFQVPWTRIGEDAPAAKGAHGNVCRQGGWAQTGIPQLHEAGFAVAAMALSDDSVPLDDPALASEERLAIVLGTEGEGLAPGTIARADYVVRIPMAHGVDSLNVAAASAVAFWELRAR